MVVYITPQIGAMPDPPEGSQIDQYCKENDYIWGSPQFLGYHTGYEQYWGFIFWQEFKNTRDYLTGFGGWLVKNGEYAQQYPAYIDMGLAEFRPHYGTVDETVNALYDDDNYMILGRIQPDDMPDDSPRWVYFELETPMPLIENRKYYLVYRPELIVTDDEYWSIWEIDGGYNNPYTRGRACMFNSNSDYQWSCYPDEDVNFFTFTEAKSCILPPGEHGDMIDCGMPPFQDNCYKHMCDDGVWNPLEYNDWCPGCGTQPLPELFWDNGEPDLSDCIISSRYKGEMNFAIDDFTITNSYEVDKGRFWFVWSEEQMGMGYIDNVAVKFFKETGSCDPQAVNSASRVASFNEVELEPIWGGYYYLITCDVSFSDVSLSPGTWWVGFVVEHEDSNDHYALIMTTDPGNDCQIMCDLPNWGYSRWTRAEDIPEVGYPMHTAWQLSGNEVFYFGG